MSWFQLNNFGTVKIVAHLLEYVLKFLCLISKCCKKVYENLRVEEKILPLFFVGTKARDIVLCDYFMY